MYRPIVRLNTNACKVCKRVFKSEKALKDHIFNNRIDDKKHILFKKQIKLMGFENAKLQCPVCKQKIFRLMGVHFKFTSDNKHRDFLKEQRTFLVNKYLNGLHCSDILKIKTEYTNNFSYKYIVASIIKSIGKSKFNSISKIILSKKRKEFWSNFSISRKKKIMKKVREAEWSKLNKEERKKHPWVIAGKKASLASSKKGSKNQRHAYNLLLKDIPNFNWIYNYSIEDGWHIDIASPKEKIFIEWGGRHHRIPIHGISYLNNRKNKDKIKNKIVINNLRGIIIRVKDEGRENLDFVEEKVKEIKKIINNSNLK